MHPVDQPGADAPAPWRAKRLPTAAALASLVVIGIFIARSATPPVDHASRTADDQAVGFRAFPLADRPALPDLTGHTLTGQRLSLAGLRGHVVVINVWGSWCAPCRKEAPVLARVSAESYPRGVRFMGIDTRDNPAAAQAFERRYGITYPSYDDPGLAQFNGLIPIAAVPSTVFVDVQGRVAARTIGRVDASTLRGEIADLLHEATSSKAPS